MVLDDFIVVFFAELRLDGFHFLAQIVLFVALLNTGVYVGLDFCLAGCPGKFFFQECNEATETCVGIEDVEHFLPMAIIVQKCRGDAIRRFSDVLATDNGEVRVAQHVVAACIILVRNHAGKAI